jgi:hypothetical protein
MADGRSLPMTERSAPSEASPYAFASRPFPPARGAHLGDYAYRERDPINAPATSSSARRAG